MMQIPSRKRAFFPFLLHFSTRNQSVLLEPDLPDRPLRLEPFLFEMGHRPPRPGGSVMLERIVDSLGVAEDVEHLPGVLLPVIRAIIGLPLGDTSLIRPTVMVNLLGEEGHSGKTYVEGLYDVCALKGATVHIYGKGVSKPKRNMGRINVTADTVKDASETGDKAYS